MRKRLPASIASTGRNRFVTGLASIGVVLICIPQLRAQDPPLQVKYGLTPAMVVKTFQPGQPFEVELVVSNGSTTPVLMRGLSMDFWYNEKNEKIFSPPGTLPHSASNWVEFVPRTFTAPAQGSAKVKMIVTPPANATGSYYSVAFVESKARNHAGRHGGIQGHVHQRAPGHIDSAVRRKE
jgi:hypothetical protein